MKLVCSFPTSLSACHVHVASNILQTVKSLGNWRKNAGATVPSVTLSCIITVIMITKLLIPFDKVSSGIEQSPWKANCFSTD